MMNDERNRQAAMRLFDACGGIDEAFLAACEDDNPGAVNVSRSKGRSAKGKRTGVVFFLSRYGKPAAAVLCILVLGAAFLQMQQMSKDAAPMENDMAANAKDGATGAAMNFVAQDAETEALLIGAEPKEAEPELEMGSGATNGPAYNVKSQETSQDLGEKQDSVQSAAIEQSMMEGTGTQQSKKKYSLEEAKNVPVVGPYVPQCWPADGAVREITVDEQNHQYALWIAWDYSDGSGFELQLMQCADAGKVSVDGAEENVIVEAGDFAADEAVIHLQQGKRVGVWYRGDEGTVLLWISGEIAAEDLSTMGIRPIS